MSSEIDEPMTVSPSPEAMPGSTRDRLLDLVLRRQARGLDIPILRADRDDRIPLSFSQQRLWFLSRLEGGSEAYHISVGLRLRGGLDRAALRRALDRLVWRHEALRTRFVSEAGEAFQEIGAADEGFGLIEQDLQGRPDAMQELEALARSEASAPFDLAAGPLIRGRLIALAPYDHVLLITMHHIVSDGWSLGVLRRELGALYSAFAQGQGDPLPELAIQYGDYTVWQRRWLSGDVLEAQRTYWREALSDAPARLELPLDRKRPARQDYSGASVPIELDEALTASLKALSQRHGVTLFMTVLAGWALVLSRLSGQSDLVVGVPSANRSRSEVEGLIGFFVNSLAVRLDLSEAPSVGGLLQRVKTRALEAQAHQDLPFEQVVEIVRPVRDLAYTPIFQALFSWQSDVEGVATEGGFGAEDFSVPQGVAQFDLTINLGERGGRVAGGLNYATALFEPETVQRWSGYLHAALREMARADERPISEIDILSPEERHRLLEEWNDTAAAYPSDLCVHELFEAQVRRDPEATALVFGDLALSYGELNRRSNRLAHHLRTMGVGPDVLVAICVERSLEMVVGLLGVLKAGGAYVPLDPEYPAERLAFMLGDAAPPVVLTHGPARDALEAAMAGLAARPNVVDLVEDAELWADLACTDPDPQALALTPANLAYVIYTSGSTGTPKGVMVEHAGIANLYWWYANRYCRQANVLLISSYAFDLTLKNILAPLMVGGRLVLAEPGVLVGADLLEAVNLHHIHLVNCAPSQIYDATTLDQKCPTLQHVILGGEAIRLDRLLPMMSPDQGPHFVNSYGPTEATDVVIDGVIVPSSNGADRVRSSESLTPPIGRPISNTRIYLLGAGLQPVPLGVAGEIHIGGAGVARGYLNRPELTAERFIESPFVPGDRLYRTGDLARYLPDGNIEFLGRNDFQVKIRGFRIELGEIEARLSEHLGVHEAVVLAREDEPGEKRLVAYYTGAEELGADLDAAALRAHLSATLPDYMVPAAYVRLEAFPLTPNGKLDRKALPAPGDEAYATQAYEAPVGPVEEALAAIWAEVLGVERVGRHDNFFELGGHSLTAVKVIAALRQRHGWETSVGDLFSCPTLAEFAGLVSEDKADLTGTILRADRDDRIPLSFSQQRLWFLSRLEGGSEAYHISVGLRLRGGLDRAALRRALDRLVWRHEALRTRFVSEAGEAFQEIGAADEGFGLIEQDLQGRPDAMQELEALARSEASAPFDLAAGPLIRGRLIALAPYDHVLLITMHHIVSDGWSLGVLRRELGALYSAFAQGQGDPLPELAIQYGDYTVWQRRWLSGDVLEAQRTYWREALSDAPARLELPLDRKRPARQDYSGASVPIELDEALTASLKALSQRHGVTLFMTVLAGWALVLSRLSGQSDLVVGVPSANRSRSEVEGLIGFFVNSLAVRLDLSEAPSVGGLLQRVKTRALEAQAHQDLPFEQVVEIVRPVRDLAYTPIFQALFSWQSDVEGVATEGGFGAEDFSVPQGVAQFDLTINLGERGGRVAGGLNYATALFEPETVQRWSGYLHAALREMARADERPISEIDILSPEERHRLLEEWNDTAAAYPSDLCVHELFEAQVRRDPEATALVFGDLALSYGELNRRSNRLAHHLRTMGVGPDVLVAICVERSLEMVVGLLGVLKAGGAYVPLDPEYPAERLAFMLGDSQAAIVLTSSRIEENLPAHWGSTILLDTDWALIEQAPLELPTFSVNPESLAYVIYTSGSTGRAKGVMVEHRNLAHYVRWASSAYASTAGGSSLVSTSLSFDATVTSLLTPLTIGGLVLLLPESDPELDELAGLLESSERLDIVKVTPSHLRVLRRSHPYNPKKMIRALVVGGETLGAHDLSPWRDQAPGVRFINEYGPTETTVGATTYVVNDLSRHDGDIPIGRPISNTRIYLLGAGLQPVPLGVAGEIHIGGAGVARGYLNRPELTAERFIESPFVPGDRLYRTGDLARYLPDGNIEFLGRNDFQVKIRGFRIELGEIEARLSEHLGVHEAVVLAREDEPGEKRLVAYYTGAEELGADLDAAALRAHLSATLPDYMVPAAYVRLEAFPLTPNGKLDRKALPAPGDEAYATQAYEAPVGPVEEALAAIWAEVLGVERVGRHDNFFELGGHSLTAVKVIERMGQRGYKLDILSLFEQPSLWLTAQVATTPRAEPISNGEAEIEGGYDSPKTASLTALSDDDMDQIGSQVSGGLANIQDIYPLMPLQEGLLYHHLASTGVDPYVVSRVLRLQSRRAVDAYFSAFNSVIKRHDILRTSIAWEGLQEAVQVVWRDAPLTPQHVDFDPAYGEIADQLVEKYGRRHRQLDLRRAPLIESIVAHDSSRDEWVVLELIHHMIDDATSLAEYWTEIQAHLAGRERDLPKPLPFRNFVAQARLGVSPEEHEAFFRTMLGDVDEPTAPFGLMDVQGTGANVTEARYKLDAALSARVGARAQALGVSAASLFHVAWGQVVAQTSGRTDPVLGTVLFGRMQGGEGADRVLGLFINTLPVRLRLGNVGAARCVRETHRTLAGLMRHEHASLAMAQKCSAVAAQAPLFTALLNYRHNLLGHHHEYHSSRERPEIEYVSGEERSNYPFTLSVDNLNGKFSLAAQTAAGIDPARICGMMLAAVEGLVEALERAPETPVGQLNILSPEERHRLLEEWNDTAAAYPSDLCVHELFEAQVRRDPEATALVFGDLALSYGELNRRSNRLAHHLRTMGVGPDVLVAICVERSLEMVVGLLGVLKAGGAYVPLDPEYPAERLAFMLGDAAPPVVLTHGPARDALEAAMAGLAARPNVVDLVEDAELWADLACTDPDPQALALTPANLAYVIYTSGSTGTPKGVMVEHAGIANLTVAQGKAFEVTPASRILQVASFSFDAAVFETVMALCLGATLCLSGRTLGPDDLAQTVRFHRVTHAVMSPSVLAALGPEAELGGLEVLILAGEPLSRAVAERWASMDRLFNAYGPTEATIWSTLHRREGRGIEEAGPPIGRPISNTRIYLLGAGLQPVPLGVAGEIHIGGAGVARGYLNRPELTAERFIESPFVPGDRLYRTGDLARYLPDGNIEFLGRNDFQVKIRGFRIELGEIEARLSEHLGVHEAVVLAREDEPGEKRLVAYYTGAEELGADLDAAALRAHLSATLPDYMVPAAYVRLEAFPLTPNGKLDRKALPAPGDEAYATQAYEAPVGPVEEALAAIWAEVLGVERVGRHDNFFELGGHSLTAVRVLQKLQSQRYRADFRRLVSREPLSSIAIHVGLSVVRHSAAATGGDALTLIRTGGEEGLILPHAVGGGLSYYEPLIDALSERYTIYGIHGLDTSPHFVAHITLAKMAAEYVSGVNAHLAPGAYGLLGWSFGGLVAHEMAHQLAARGGPVAFLGVIDTDLGAPSRNEGLPVRGAWLQFLEQIRAPILLGANLSAQVGTGDFDELSRLFRSTPVPHDLRISGAELEAVFEIFLRNTELARTHLVGDYIGEVTAFRARQAVFAPARSDGMGRAQAQFVDLPGNHFTILQQPAVGLIAKHVNELPPFCPSRRPAHRMRKG